MINHGLQQNSDHAKDAYRSGDFVIPKKMLTEVGIKSCTTRPETHWQRRSDWLKEATHKSWGKKKSFSSNNPASVWAGLRNKYETQPPDLWRIWLRIWMCFTVSQPTPVQIFTYTPAHPANPSSPSCYLTWVYGLCVEDIRQVFKKT